MQLRTMFLSHYVCRCVLVYVSEDQSQDLLKNLREMFTGDVLAFVNYEQVRSLLFTSFFNYYFICLLILVVLVICNCVIHHLGKM